MPIASTDEEAASARPFIPTSKKASTSVASSSTAARPPSRNRPRHPCSTRSSWLTPAASRSSTRYAPPHAPSWSSVGTGQNVFDDTDEAHEKIADAIAAFARTRAFNEFTSRFDAYLTVRAKLTKQEKRGLKLFEAEVKGNRAGMAGDQQRLRAAPKVARKVNSDELGDLGVTTHEVGHIAAFMRTLSDGWLPLARR